MNNLIFGSKVIKQIIEDKPTLIENIYLKSSHNLLPFVQRQKLNYVFWPKQKFEQLFKFDNHQYIAAQIKPFNYYPFPNLIKNLQKPTKIPQLILILDHLQDSYNFGSILRTAQAVGVQAVIISNFNQVLINAKTIKAAMGFLFSLPVVKVANLHNALLQLKKCGFWILTSSVLETKKTTKEIDLSNPKLVLIIGNENKGVKRLLTQESDFTWKIPMLSTVESLNTSNAAAILMYQIRYQQEFWTLLKKTKN